MILWWLFHIHHLYLDACTALFPLPALPFILFTWIIINNISSTTSPFEVNTAFYKWSYALPANEDYIVLQDILVWGRCATASPAPCDPAGPIRLVDCGPRSRDLRPLPPLLQSRESGRQDGEIDQRGVSGELDSETENNL
jgi:hypothetical protein